MLGPPQKDHIDTEPCKSSIDRRLAKPEPRVCKCTTARFVADSRILRL